MSPSNLSSYVWAHSVKKVSFCGNCSWTLSCALGSVLGAIHHVYAWEYKCVQCFHGWTVRCNVWKGMQFTFFWICIQYKRVTQFHSLLNTVELNHSNATLFQPHIASLLHLIVHQWHTEDYPNCGPTPWSLRCHPPQQSQVPLLPTIWFVDLMTYTFPQSHLVNAGVHSVVSIRRMICHISICRVTVISQGIVHRFGSFDRHPSVDLQSLNCSFSTMAMLSMGLRSLSVQD